MMRLFWILTLLLFVAGGAMAEDPHVTIIPDGVESAPPFDGSLQIPCDILLRYDDGIDNTPGSGYTLGGPSAPYQYLGIIATPPSDYDYEVQSAGFWSEFWVTPGNVNFTIIEISDPSNTTTASLFVNDGGTWEIEFDTPITVGPGSDFAIMLCPDPGVWGVGGEDTTAPLYDRSYFSSSTDGCYPTNPLAGVNMMIWACVTPGDPTPVEPSSWGNIKSLYK